jgi:hypothetical protein
VQNWPWAAAFLGLNSLSSQAGILYPLLLRHPQISRKHHLLKELGKRRVVVQQPVEPEAHVYQVLDAVFDHVVNGILFDSNWDIVGDVPEKVKDPQIRLIDLAVTRILL